MIQDRIAHRYARSLFDLVQEHGQADRVLEDFRGITTLLRESDDFRAFIHSPILSAERKWPILLKIFDGKLSEPVMNFLELLTQRGREELIRDVALEYERIYNQANRILPVTLTTAVELNDELVEQLRKKLASSFDQQIELHRELDERLIGGFVLSLGDRQYDGSVRQALRRARRQLSA